MINYREAFVYIWLELTTNKWYLGYHKGTCDDGYICSSKIVKPMILAHPERWHREIIAHGTQQAMIDLERELLTTCDAKNHPDSYNFHNGNGNTQGGRTIMSNPELSVNELNKLTTEQVIDLYAEVLEEHNTKKIFYLDRFLLSKVLANRPQSEQI